MHPIQSRYYLVRYGLCACMIVLALLFSTTARSTADAGEEITVEVQDTELFLQRFAPAGGGEELIIWVSPGFGDHKRAYDVAAALSRRGIEVWHIDLAQSLFLTQGTSTLRALDGRYVAGLVAQAHQRTGKSITLMTRSYAALPVLRGARLWQIQAAESTSKNNDYFTGAILFSPELYSEIPPLGQDPVYDPIASATSIPIMLYQAGRRGNRWQLDRTLEKLRHGGASVHVKILPGVTGAFYLKDSSRETRALLNELPQDIERTLSMLKRIPTPLEVNDLAVTGKAETNTLDTTLKPFSGDMKPLAIELRSISGNMFTRTSFDGKVTLVNFWASWCGPCVEEIPALNRLREHMKNRPFELISINYAEEPDRIHAFLDMVKVDFPVLLDQDGSYSAQWNVLVYPATFVIAADGTIAYGVNGAIQWDSAEVIASLEALMSR